MLPKRNTKPVAVAGFTNMPTGYFLRLAGLFTQSPGNLGHRGHTCTVSETELELHSGTNQPQRPTPEYDPEGPVGLAWLQRGWHWVQLALSPPARQRQEWCVYLCMCVLCICARWQREGYTGCHLYILPSCSCVFGGHTFVIGSSAGS